MYVIFFFFFFQAEDGIRDLYVTGVQTCALPIYRTGLSEPMPMPGPGWADYGPWTRRVKIDLSQLRAYAQAVAEQTDGWLGSLSDADLDQPMDLSQIGLGHHTRAS